MSLSHRRASSWIPAALACIAALTFASQASAADDAPSAVPTAEVGKRDVAEAPIGQWIKDLDSDLFATRQAAAQKLKEAGLPAVGPVAEAAGGSSLEVTAQAVEILRHLMKSDQTPTREAAKAALEKLSKGDNSAASQAREALAPPPAPQQQPQYGIKMRGGFGGGGIQIGIGGQIQAVPGGGQVFRIQQRVAAGATTTEVDANGKKIKIEKDANGGIEMRVTEKVNGQDKTDTYKAKDADELKKKSPEAYKLYEKYGQQGQAGVILGNIQIQGIAVPIGQIQGIAIPVGPIQGIAVPIQQVPAIPLQALPKQDVPATPVPAKPNPASETKPNAATDVQHKAASDVPPNAGADAQQIAAGDARQNAVSELARARRLIAAASEQLKQTAQPADAESAKKTVDDLQAALDKLDEVQRALKP
jgi:hypothetical protein